MYQHIECHFLTATIRYQYEYILPRHILLTVVITSTVEVPRYSITGFHKLLIDGNDLILTCPSAYY